MRGYITNIESLGLVDGPGIRTVVFLGGCRLRCKYCENPETWQIKEPNITAEDLAKKIIRNKPYFKRNSGGVTFSGGEPLLQKDFLISVCKILKRENIHIALDTAGVGFGDYKELLSYIDLVLLDIKHVEENTFTELTGGNLNDSLAFIKDLNESNKDVWIRQVITPNLTDTEDYIKKLAIFLRQIKNIKRIDFLPYHKLGDHKYKELGIKNPFQNKEEMNKEKTEQLYKQFLQIYKEGNF